MSLARWRPPMCCGSIGRAVVENSPGTSTERRMVRSEMDKIACTGNSLNPIGGARL